MSNNLSISSSTLSAQLAAEHNIPEPIVKKVLPILMSEHKISWEKRNVSVSAEDQATLTQLFRDLVHHGEGAMPTANYPPKSAAESFWNKISGKSNQLAKVKGDHDSIFSYFYSVAIEAQEHHINEFREEYFRQLSQIKPHDNEVIRSCCAYPLLTFLPFMKPAIGRQFCFNNINYIVDNCIDLPTLGGSIPVYVLKDQNESLTLVFKGSTFPGDKGYAASWLSDFTPAVSVGHFPARSKELKEWFDNHNDVTVIGASLGGSLALQMVSLYGDKLKEAHAFNPAGLTFCKNFKEENENVPVYIYSQWNDLVSNMGYFPKWATVYRIMADDADVTRAHAEVFAGKKEVTVIKTTGSYQNSRTGRHLLSSAHKLGSIVPFTIIGSSTVMYNIYDVITRQSIGRKEKTSYFDIATVITQIALGALLIAVAIYARKHRQLPQIKKIIQEIGTKRFEQSTMALIIIGSLMTAGGLRAIGHFKKKKPRVKS